MDSRTEKLSRERACKFSLVCCLNYHFISQEIRDTNLWKSWVTHMSIPQLFDFSSTKKKTQNADNKVYLLKFRLHSLLSVETLFGDDKFWFRLHQPLFLTICEFIRSLLAFEQLKLSLIARFLMFFSVSHCIISACWFVTELLLLVGGWIFCRSPDTRSQSSVIKRRLWARRMFGRPLYAMK